MIPDWVTVDVTTTAGLSLIVGGVILAIIRGWLVPKSQVDRLDATYQRQLADAWAAATAKDATIAVLAAQQQRLLEAAYPVLGKVRDETA